MQDDQFEWDDDKARANLARHKLSFEAARAVFEDVAAIDELDDRENYGEERFNRTGLTNGVLVTVCYTEREDRYRIISARRATKREHEAYFGRR